MKFKPVHLKAKTRRTKSKRVRVAALAALIVLAIATIAAIAIPRNSSHASPKKYKATTAIVRDEATGTLRKPTPEETDAMVAQISSLTNRSTEGLATTQSANGTVKMDLQGGFNGVVLGRATADGGTEVRCVFTLDEATDFLGLEEDQ